MLPLAAVNLTEGAVAFVSNPDRNLDDDFKPVLQVLDVRLVNAAQNQNGGGGNSTERYRLVLSDGVHSQQGMLATQLNELVRAQMLKKGSIVRLAHFVCNCIKGRLIIIVIQLDVILDKCDLIGEPKPYMAKVDNCPPSTITLSGSVSVMNQSGNVASNPVAIGAGSVVVGSVSRPTIPGVPRGQPSVMDSHTHGSNPESRLYNSTTAPSVFANADPGSGISRAPANSYLRPPQPSYHHPSQMYSNRGPITRNEAPVRIIPIAALNPYSGRWTIKARVTSKGELRQYNNQRGDGKVFSFDLLDESSEIRVTCFNAVADQFYHQIEQGKVYMISKGSLKPAQKAFNHLQNDHEIQLDSYSTIEPCYDDDGSIPHQNWHFRPIGDIEGLENNSVLDLIGIVTSISPCSTIMRRNGTETQKRTLQLKDMSGRSIEVTLWGNYCNAEGQTLQNMCDSGVFPVLAIKFGRVSDFNGKAVGTISTSQLFIEPDFPQARQLKDWFDKNGKNTPSVSLSRDTTSMVRTDVRKTISQIKDERLGTSEKPDWIALSATLIFIKVDNFCYTACPIKIGDRQCNKKVTNNGDGKWRCERCEQTIDECDYRYILQLQIQDHTGLTWVTAFQESGEEVLGVSAKDLHYLKYEEQDDDRFNEIMRGAVFWKYIFKLKVKEETFNDEQRVKSTVVKAERLNFESETKYLFNLIDKLKQESLGFVPMKTENVFPNSGLNSTGSGIGNREPATSFPNYNASGSSMLREMGIPTGTSYGSQYGGSRFGAAGQTVMQSNCNRCGGTGHTSMNCPQVTNTQQQSYGGGFSSRVSSGPTAGGASSECFKCHQMGHWAKDCPNVNNVPPAYGGGNVTPGRCGSARRQPVGGF